MKVSNKMIQEVIKRVTISVTQSGFEKFKLALELYWARHVINWDMTDYGSWSKFCTQHIRMSQGSIDRYVTAIILVNHFKYTDAQCKKMIEGIGWDNFIHGLLDLNRKISVKGFITKYFRIGQASKVKAKKGGDRAYAFSLPAEVADKLDVYLVANGMSIGDQYRRGIRDAMIKLINRKLK